MENEDWGSTTSEEDESNGAVLNAYGRAITLSKKEVEQHKRPNMWFVGGPCCVECSKDGKTYEATVHSELEDKGTCVITYVGYGIVEEVRKELLKASQGPEARRKQEVEAAKEQLVDINSDEDSSVTTPEVGWDDTALVKAYDRALLPNEKVEDWKDLRKWHVGDPCRAVCSKDGVTYEATVVSVSKEKKTCVIRYVGYGNVEVVPLKLLATSLGPALRRIQEQQAVQEWKEEKEEMEQSDEDSEEDKTFIQPQQSSVQANNKIDRKTQSTNSSESEMELSDWDAMKDSPSSQPRLNSAQAKKMEMPSQSARPPKKFNVTPHNLKSRQMTTKAEMELIGSDSVEDTPLAQLRLLQKKKKIHRQFQSARPPKKSSFMPHNLRSLPMPLEAMPPMMNPLLSLPHITNSDTEEDTEALSSMLMSWYLCGFHTGYYKCMDQAKKLASRGRGGSY